MDGGIDLVGVAQATVAGALVVHFCLLRPWNARADLLLTVEMIDKDLTADLDRGSLPVDDPVVAELRRCLSLGRKRSDAAQASANLLALLTPEESAGLWPPSVDLARLTPGQQNILLEYTEELADATAAYLRTTHPLRRTARRRPFLPRPAPEVIAAAETDAVPDQAEPVEAPPAPANLRTPASSIVFSESSEPAAEPRPPVEPMEDAELPEVAAGPIAAREQPAADVIELPNSIDLADAEAESAESAELPSPAPTGHRPPIERTGRRSRLIAPEPLTFAAEPNPAAPATLAASAALAAATTTGPATPGEGIRHSRESRSGWHLRPRHARNQPADDAPIPPRILDLSTEIGSDGIYGNRSEDRLALDRRTMDRVSLDRAAVNRLMYNEVDVPSPFPAPITPTADLPAVPSPRSGARDVARETSEPQGTPPILGQTGQAGQTGQTRPRPAPRLK